jgi:hypothetical protein
LLQARTVVVRVVFILPWAGGPNLGREFAQQDWRIAAIKTAIRLR